MVLDFFFDSFCRLALVSQVSGPGMRIEAAQLDAFVTEILQLVQDLVEIVGRLLLIEDDKPNCRWKVSSSYGNLLA